MVTVQQLRLNPNSDGGSMDRFRPLKSIKKPSLFFTFTIHFPAVFK